MTKNVSIQDVVSQLESRGYGVKRSGGVYRSQCPAHDGKDFNLAFTEGDKKQVVFTCHSHQCSYNEIMTSLGFEKEIPVEMKPIKKKSVYGGKTVHPTFEKAVAAAAYGAQIERPPDAVYRYDNIDGTENLAIARWNAESGKQTRPVSKVCDGYIAGTKSDEGYPIYRLPKIVQHLKSSDKSARIFICEGEKATEAAVSVGLEATTSAFGSKSAAKSNWAVLDQIAVEHGVKLEIVILPDNDKPGQQYAESLIEIFAKFKCRPTVKTVSLADFAPITGIKEFPDGGDFYDLCELLDSKTNEEIRKMVENMLESTLPEVEIVEDEPDAVYPWRPFPVDLLPETVSKFIGEVSQANGCDPAGVAIATLVALATAIGNSRRLRLKRGWVFPAILWGMLIARKGSIKSWALAPAVKPLDEKQHEYQNQYNLEKADYNRKKAEYMTLSASQRRKETPFDLKEPLLKRIVSRESTDQKVVKNCAENPRGFCIFSDELATLLQGMGQYCKDSKGGNAQSIFNSLFNGEGLESERIGESRYAPHAFVCILGGIQPSIARQCFDKQAFESGFASRFMPVASWSDTVVPDEIESAFHKLTLHLLRLKMEPVYSAPTVEYDEWNPNGVTSAGEQIGVRPALVDTSPDALTVYQEYFNRAAGEMRATDDDNIRGAFEKLRSYVARLALVIHVTRAAERHLMYDNSGPNAPWSADRINEFQCDAESMRAAVVIGEWFKYEVLRAYATWGGLADEAPTPKVNGFQQRIVEYLEQKHEPVSLSDLKRRFKSEKDAVPNAVEVLLGQGLIEPLAPEMSGPGRRSELYRLKK